VLGPDGPTPHLEGTRGDYAPTVLLPGDPKRARHIADTYLDDVRQVNAVRGADGFTGTYRGLPVSVQAVGMGVPSVAIYYTELIRFYGVTTLIRVGSCGGISENLTLGDTLVATSAGTDSAAVKTINSGLDLPPTADFDLLRRAVEFAEANDIPVAAGPVWTSDLFYGPDDDDTFAILAKHGVLAVEMEVAALYAIAAAEGVRALGLLAVSDDIARGQMMSSADRETSFDAMFRVALSLVE
jgi:purine-nucleoside phosphorylase